MPTPLAANGSRSASKRGFSHPARDHVLDLLIRAETFEQVLHSRYIGTKRYSLEGLAMLIPLLDRDIAKRRGRPECSKSCWR